MSITIDHEPLEAARFGFTTVGQVLSHCQRDNRFVVQLLIDGSEPPADELPAVRQKPLNGHAIFIETADPRQLAIEVLEEVARQMPESRRLKSQAAGLLSQSAPGKAMEQLAGYLRIWQDAQDSILKVAQLLRLNLDGIAVKGRPIVGIIDELSSSLRQIKSALEQRDFVLLADVLLYETAGAEDRWVSMVEEMEAAIRGIR